MRYVLVVARSREGWHGTFPEIPHCTVEGASEGEVVARAREALVERLRNDVAAGVAPGPPRLSAPGHAVDVPHDIALAIELCDARHRAGLSPSELALRADVPQRLIEDLEAALTPPMLDKVIPIASALGMRPVIELGRPGEAVGLTRRRPPGRPRSRPEAVEQVCDGGPDAVSFPSTDEAPLLPGPRAGSTSRRMTSRVKGSATAAGGTTIPSDDWPSWDVLRLRYIGAVLERSKGNKTHAAEVLGINRRSLNRILARDRAKAAALARYRQSAPAAKGTSEGVRDADLLEKGSK